MRVLLRLLAPLLGLALAAAGLLLAIEVVAAWVRPPAEQRAAGAVAAVARHAGAAVLGGAPGARDRARGRRARACC